jgi:PAS domain S-box-containing protein
VQSDAARPQDSEPLKEILDRLNIGFYRSDRNSRIVQVNHAAMRIYGYTAQDLATTFTTRDTALSLLDWQRVRGQVVDLGHAAGFISQARRKDDSLIFLEFSLRRLEDPNGSFTGIEGVFREVTAEVTLMREQAALTSSVQQAHRRSLQFSSLQEDLLFSLSHDLKTPPVVVQGFAELLLRGRYGALTPEQEKPVQTIYRNILSLSDMVDQLLDFSRLLKQVHAPPSHISLAQAWREECAGFGKSGQVLASFSACLVEGDDTVFVSHRALHYALRNLACNALRIACPGREIACIAQRDGLWVQLQLDLPALPEDHPSLPRLLEGMFQPSSAPLADAGLDGTGLAATRYLAVLMGGDLSCEEMGPTRGKFTLRLPAAPPSSIPR